MTSTARPLRPIVGVVAFLLCAAGAARARQAAPDYGALASQYRASHGLNDLPVDQESLGPALDRGFAALDLGFFDLRYSWNALADQKRADEWKQMVLAILDVQARWLQWLDERDPAPKGAPTPEFATIRQWVTSWKMDAIRKSVASSDAARSYLSLAGADEQVVVALKTFAEGMRTGAAARLKTTGPATQLVLAPTRAEFKGFAAFAGSLCDDCKALLWTPSLPLRNEFHLDDLVCLALEGPPADGGDAGVSLSASEKTGLLEHVAQYAADRLLRHDCGPGIDPALQVGVGVDLVIDLFGQNNSRVAGSGEGNKTPERNKFVRGGRSSGGKLPKISADSQWRESRGKDWFVGALVAAQKEGAKLALKDRPGAPGPTAHFILDCKDFPGEHELATAPFLGAAAASKEIPANFFADYQEFLRAYRSCFVHWLATEAKSKAAGAAPRPFARLLRSCITDAARPFEDRVAEIFGTPLTGATPDGGALEWQFLAWVSRQK